MIISHKHRFIFIKNRKTASTSVEIALSGICGAQDVITPISPQDEEVRQRLGFRGAQNHVLEDGTQCYNHMPIAEVKRFMNAHDFAHYYKFVFERNPWDKFISAHDYHKATCASKSQQSTNRLRQHSLNRYLLSRTAVGQLRGMNLYAIDGKVAVDRVCLYEELDAEMAHLSQQLQVEIPELPFAKSHFRQDTRSWREALSWHQKILIGVLFRREIKLWGGIKRS